MDYVFEDTKELKYGREVILEQKLRYFESYSKYTPSRYASIDTKANASLSGASIFIEHER